MTTRRHAAVPTNTRGQPDGGTDATTSQVGVDPNAAHVPEPASGVRGADQVDAFDA